MFQNITNATSNATSALLSNSSVLPNNIDKIMYVGAAFFMGRKFCMAAGYKLGASVAGLLGKQNVADWNKSSNDYFKQAKNDLGRDLIGAGCIAALGLGAGYYVDSNLKEIQKQEEAAAKAAADAAAEAQQQLEAQQKLDEANTFTAKAWDTGSWAVSGFGSGVAYTVSYAYGTATEYPKITALLTYLGVDYTQARYRGDAARMSLGVVRDGIKTGGTTLVNGIASKLASTPVDLNLVNELKDLLLIKADALSADQIARIDVLKNLKGVFTAATKI